MANPGTLYPAQYSGPGQFELPAIDTATKQRIELRTGPRPDASAVAAWKRLRPMLPRTCRWYGDFVRLTP